jgi:hypothetical protein
MFVINVGAGKNIKRHPLATSTQRERGVRHEREECVYWPAGRRRGHVEYIWRRRAVQKGGAVLPAKSGNG